MRDEADALTTEAGTHHAAAATWYSQLDGETIDAKRTADKGQALPATAAMSAGQLEICDGKVLVSPRVNMNFISRKT